MFSNQLIDIPEDFLCPITQELMEEPVVAADGHTYEKAAITKWLEKGNKTSPYTGERLKHDVLTDNFVLKKIISDFKEKLPSIQLEKQIKVDLDKAIKLREEILNSYLEKKELEIKEKEYKNQQLVEEIGDAKSKNSEIEMIFGEKLKIAERSLLEAQTKCFANYSELKKPLQLLLNSKLENAHNSWNIKTDDQKHVLLDELGLSDNSYDFLNIGFRQKLSEQTQIQRHAIEGKHPSTEEFWNTNKELQLGWMKKI